MNLELFKEIVDFIKANPQHWNQRTWHCGTSHCVAGFIEQRVNGRSFCSEATAVRPEMVHWQTFAVGRDTLGLSTKKANWLFDPKRTLAELQIVAKHGKVTNRMMRRSGMERLLASTTT